MDQWFAPIKLSISLRRFRQLPRNPAYKYEYIGGQAWLSPRPAYYNARLALRPPPDGLPGEVEVHHARVRFRRLEDRDWPRLSRVFAGAFQRVQPFQSLGDRRRLEAARDCLRQTRGGHHGPIIHAACHVAHDESRDCPIGASLVTLIPPVDLDDPFGMMRWDEPPPPDCVERRLGHAHLTWVFVGQRYAGHGIGSALLDHASVGLVELGYTELVSSFLLGNDSSMLWHWRNGFELLPYSGSPRQFREWMRRQESGAERPEPDPTT